MKKSLIIGGVIVAVVIAVIFAVSDVRAKNRKAAVIRFNQQFATAKTDTQRKAILETARNVVLANRPVLSVLSSKAISRRESCDTFYEAEYEAIVDGDLDFLSFIQGYLSGYGC